MFRIGSAGLLSILLLTSAGCESDTGPTTVTTSSGCDPSKVVETGAHRRLALIVGVGEYQNPRVPDLKGPPNDARAFYALLTGKNGYGFPKENVCLLLDEQATLAGFKKAFDETLVGRARPGDIAVLYYAGHGSQTRDRNGDEPDEWDETLMLHDARSGGVRDLIDDELNQMLRRLHAKTPRMTVILDSCNAGTATRGTGAGTVMARFFTPLDDAGEAADTASEAGDGGGGWVPAELPGAVVMTAATDHNPALEKDGHGIFTNALVEVMSQVAARPLTYAQVARQAPPLVASESPQVPYFQGDLTGLVFNSRTRTQPIAWELRRLGPPIELAGPPLPGIGKGAELRIYDGAATGAETRDPGKAKATVVVQEISGLNAKVAVSARSPKAAPLKEGDLAVPVRPADAYTRLRLRLRPAGETGGLPAERAQALRRLIEQDPDAVMLVELTQGPGDFELAVRGDGRLVLRGPENRVRNTYGRDRAVPRSLWQHARQQALLQLRGEGGNDFVDQETLLVRIVPASRSSGCAHGRWIQAEAPNTEQVVPLCHTWNVQVTLSREAPVPLLIGALVLSTDGGVYALPADERKVRLQPGETYTFKARRETFLGQPPLDVQDRVLVFGTQETNPVSWRLFAEPAVIDQGTRGTMSGLGRALDRYLRPGTRGAGLLEEGPIEDTTWTLSTLTLRVRANPGFLDTTGRRDQPIASREYTIADFDIRPYLPDDPDTALYQVLLQADRLARASAHDGYGYKQHPWNRGRDAENLRLGIDCSRAIWFAFTRAGLPYNHDQRYLSTAQMVTADTPMREEFESCSDDPELRIGDVLVYRDDQRGDGHVVMVIDPERRIAWGSHGWDGTPRDLPVEPDTGVEYQKIKYKPDWRRWDRSTMERKACWRYRRFNQERATGRGLPGTSALQEVCDPKHGCGRL